MASISIVLYKGKVLKDGRHPVMISVTKDGKVARKAVGSASVAEWDSKNARLKSRVQFHEEINLDIENAFHKYRQNFRILKEKQHWNPADVFKEIRQTNTFFENNMEAYAESISHKKPLSIVGAISKGKKILRYSGDFDMSAVDSRWLRGFEKWCKTEEKAQAGGKGNTDNTIAKAIQLLKRVAKFAGVVNPDLYSWSATEKKVVKQKLTLAELETIKGLELAPGSNVWHARNLFLLSIYFRGMRVSDMLQLNHSDMVDGRLIYKTSKTDHSHDMKIIPQAQAILDQYEGEGTIFPFLQEHPDRFEQAQRIKTATAMINGLLKEIAKKAGINKKISTHTARHTFASLSDKSTGDIAIVQKLLGHKSRAITEGYLAELRKSDELDDAADKIFG